MTATTFRQLLVSLSFSPYLNIYEAHVINVQTFYLSLPGGLMYVREWNNLQYASAAAILLSIYSDYLSAANAKLTCPEGQIPPQELLNFAKSQVLDRIYVGAR